MPLTLCSWGCVRTRRTIRAFELLELHDGGEHAPDEHGETGQMVRGMSSLWPRASPIHLCSTFAQRNATRPCRVPVPRRWVSRCNACVHGMSLIASVQCDPISAGPPGAGRDHTIALHSEPFGLQSPTTSFKGRLGRHYPWAGMASLMPDLTSDLNVMIPWVCDSTHGHGHPALHASRSASAPCDSGHASICQSTRQP